MFMSLLVVSECRMDLMPMSFEPLYVSLFNSFYWVSQAMGSASK